MMELKEMWEKVCVLKEQTIINCFDKPDGVDEFFEEHWMQILDLLDDLIYEHLPRK